MPEGDVVTCCADGVARVWTSDPNKADPAAAALMEGDMAAAQLEKEKASLAEDQAKIKTEDPEVLQMPGASDGATKVIKEAWPFLTAVPSAAASPLFILTLASCRGDHSSSHRDKLAV